MAKRVGLLTLPLHINYGGILQIAALAQFLAASGKDVVLLERTQAARRRAIILALKPLPFLGRITRWAERAPGDPAGGALGRVRRKLAIFASAAMRARRAARHRAFIERFIPRFSGPLRSTVEMRAAIDRFDLNAVIVGSDQVWRLDYLPPGAVEDYFLGFAEGTAARRIAYAASFGKSIWAFPRQTARIRDLLARFDAVSVREDSGLDICRTDLGRDDVAHVVDPTLLVDPSFYEAAAGPRSAAPGFGPVILTYILDGAETNGRIVDAVSAALGDDHSVRTLTLDGEAELIAVGDWLRAFMDAEFVITDSFHGTVFAILFRKRFIAIANRARGADRFTSLLALLDLDDRLLDEETFERAAGTAAQPIDFDRVHARIAEQRERSAAFLLDALA